MNECMKAIKRVNEPNEDELEHTYRFVSYCVCTAYMYIVLDIVSVTTIVIRLYQDGLLASCFV